MYRSADCFVTMSLSETFGLTCLEARTASLIRVDEVSASEACEAILQAMMCGCPAVMPFCSVFDEIWLDKDKPLTPKEISPTRVPSAPFWCGSAKLRKTRYV